MALQRVIVLDLETSLHNEEVGKFKANPHSDNNWFPYSGIQRLDVNDLQPDTDPEIIRVKRKEDVVLKQPYATGEVLYVGHNIGYDILFLCGKWNTGRDSWLRWLKHPDALVWDTQLAEYRLKGQSISGPATSLDTICEARGMPTKPGRLKEYWNNGISTEDIPEDEVRPYLTHDVEVTGELFRRQVAEAMERGMLDMLRIEMQSRLATIMMEYNGMAFDADGAKAVMDTDITPMRKQAESDAIEVGYRFFGLPKEAVKPASPAFLKAVLYGGTVKWKERRVDMDPVNGQPIIFKSGKKKGEAKQKWFDMELEFVARSPLILVHSDEEALTKIMEHSKCNPTLRTFLQHVIDFRNYQKQEKTYFTGYADLTWPDGMIHANLNHCIAATGRLSMSGPNLQNAGHSPIRKHFKSRYPDGHLMEVDLSQIEVVVQAFLSQDANMLQDIKDGIDFHSKRAAFAHHTDYSIVNEAVKDESHIQHGRWKGIRKSAKVVSFQKAYGAGVKKISATTGLSRQEVKAFMEAEDANYPQVPKTQEAWIAEVNRSCAIRDGVVCGVLRSPINVEYRFLQEDWNGHKEFKPTCIKNYPIQGFSADIIKMILGRLRGMVWELNELEQPEGWPPVLMVNTVHDSVIFDLPAWVDRKAFAKAAIHLFKTHPISVLKNTFGVDFNAPISADAEEGTNWMEMQGVST